MPMSSMAGGAWAATVVIRSSSARRDSRKSIVDNRMRRSSMRMDADGRISPSHRSHEQRLSSSTLRSGALVVGHVVVDLNLARDDIRFRLIRFGSDLCAENDLVVVVDRVIDAALFQAQQKNTRLPVSVLGVHERLVSRHVDVLQHRSQDFAGKQTVLVGIDADAE